MILKHMILYHDVHMIVRCCDLHIKIMYYNVHSDMNVALRKKQISCNIHVFFEHGHDYV